MTFKIYSSSTYGVHKLRRSFLFFVHCDIFISHIETLISTSISLNWLNAVGPLSTAAKKRALSLRSWYECVAMHCDSRIPLSKDACTMYDAYKFRDPFLRPCKVNDSLSSWCIVTSLKAVPLLLLFHLSQPWRQAFHEVRHSTIFSCWLGPKFPTLPPLLSKRDSVGDPFQFLRNSICSAMNVLPIDVKNRSNAAALFAKFVESPRFEGSIQKLLPAPRKLAKIWGRKKIRKQSLQ